MSQQRQPLQLHLEWGPQAIATAPEADLFVIVDLLSFSTCVDIALSRGAWVYPFDFKDHRAHAFALAEKALLAQTRSHDEISLSPASLRKLEPGQKVVLPSPNGSSLSKLTGKTPTVCACLRNARAVADWIRQQGYQQIQLVAAGERWPDDSLRPAIEDQLGAGAVINFLQADDVQLSAEAQWALSSFSQAVPQLQQVIQACQSGQELLHKGFPQDIELAAQLNCSRIIPLLENGIYKPAHFNFA